MPATEPQIARINELSTLARTAWFSLLGYLVFVGITLLGVKDADFFVPSRQTDLPLVGVEIPTASFFWTAPILGAALYTYLHLFLIKLWDAHGEARTTDADPTHHWLVNDFVLIRQRDPAARARPLAWLTDWITRLLVWAAGPIVLAYAWWRSMPAHNEWLTLLIAACLWLTLVVGFTSWWRAEASLGRLRPLHWSTGAAVPTAGLARAPPRRRQLAPHRRRPRQLRRRLLDPRRRDLHRIPADTPVVRWFTDGGPPPPARPHRPRRAWSSSPCPTTGAPRDRPQRLPRDLVPARGTRDDRLRPTRRATHDTPTPRRRRRKDWCAEHGYVTPDACAEHFADLDRALPPPGKRSAAAPRPTTPQLDLRGRDLRRAKASGVSLVGAKLAGARTGGSELCRGPMEGADLGGAQMEGANLERRRLTGANLTDAQMEGADL